MRYKIIMTNFNINKWFWYIYGNNGKLILESKIYRNRTQCRNVMMEFSRLTRIPYKEIE